MSPMTQPAVLCTIVVVRCCPLQSVIDRPLLERLDLLKAAIAPPPPEGIFVGKGTVKGSLAKLIPGEVMLDHTVCSKICHSVEDIQAAFDEAIRVQVCMLSSYPLQSLSALTLCTHTLHSHSALTLCNYTLHSHSLVRLHHC